MIDFARLLEESQAGDCGYTWPHWRDDHDCYCEAYAGHRGPHRCSCGARRVRFE